MKKSLAALLALASILPFEAHAALLKNLKVSGQLDLEAVAANNITDLATRKDKTYPTAPAIGGNDRIGEADLRLILRTDWDLFDDVHSRVTLVKGGVVGNNRTFGSGAQTLDGVQTTISVEEAFVRIDKLLGAVDATIGRQFYGEPGDLIVYYGPTDDYGLNVGGLDAGRFDWRGENVSVTGLVAKIISAGGVAATGGFSSDLRGLTAAFKLGENMNPNVYLYNQVVHNAITTAPSATSFRSPNSFLWVLGVKNKFTWGNAYASGELAKNFGEQRSTAGGAEGNYEGWALLARAGYKADVAGVGLFHPWGEFGIGSGDSSTGGGAGPTAGKVLTFQSINTDYRPGGIYGHFEAGATTLGGGTVAGAASNGLSNKVIYGFGVKATPASLDKLTAGLQFYKYAFQKAQRATISGVNVPVGTNIGSEIDVTGEWKHSENVAVKLTLGSFQPGSVFYNAAHGAIVGLGRGVNPAVMAAADLTIKF